MRKKDIIMSKLNRNGDSQSALLNKEAYMRKYTLVMVILALIVIFVGCNHNQDEKGKQTYVSEEYGFSITFPEEWKDRYTVRDNDGVGIQIVSKANDATGHDGLLCVVNKKEIKGMHFLHVPGFELERQRVVDSQGVEKEYAFTLYFATDVNYDSGDKDLTKEYFDMTQTLEKRNFSFELLDSPADPITALIDITDQRDQNEQLVGYLNDESTFVDGINFYEIYINNERFLATKGIELEFITSALENETFKIYSYGEVDEENSQNIKAYKLIEKDRQERTTIPDYEGLECYWMGEKVEVKLLQF